MVNNVISTMRYLLTFVNGTRNQSYQTQSKLKEEIYAALDLDELNILSESN